MQVWSLSSGSSGNCYLVREGDSLLLLEAGIGVARVARELSCLGFPLSQLSAILVGHEHVDHWRSATALARRLRIPLVCTPGSWQAGGSGTPPAGLQLLRAGSRLTVGGLTVEAFPVPHDACEPVGFVLSSARASICLATDMGRATEQIVERALLADLVILEANHDVEMLVTGPYPAHLKARILGDRGHLSNEDAARAVVRMARGRPRDFWLAHLSRTNNSPRIALSAVLAALRREGLADLRVSVALRDRKSLYWDSERSLEQLPLW